ncbi:MAG: DUF4832 domain-containing protein, partial [Anaerolineae bacterium]|nr:DUF4832 domain-containing protein [Anaerolineae bacterium]
MIKFTPISDPVTNPLMGLSPWANIDKNIQPHSLVYADLTWRDFEPEEGKFNFERFESENKLAYWRSKGVRVVFRFVMDHPSEKEHMDIPDWLYEAINHDGDFYQNDYGQG